MKKIFFCILFLMLINFSLSENYNFISSRTSNVFHYLDCRYVTESMLGSSDFYLTYEEAIADGLRECRVCEPSPLIIPEPEPEPEPYPEDPNRIWIEPSPTPATLFPISGVVLQSEYCYKPFDPDKDIGGTILKTNIHEVSYGDIKDDYIKCSLCASSINESTDPNYVVLIADNDRIHFHLDIDCKQHKEVPVRMVNLRSGMIAGNDAYFHPAMGVLEWKITPFEMGDYTAVMNSDVDQMQLLSLTIKQTSIPQLEEFTNSWLKGNFNLYKYNEWVKQRELHRSRIDNAFGATGAVEWVFQDGQWVPVSNGSVPNTDFYTMEITEHTTYGRKTIKEEMKVAPYEWRTKLLKIIEETTTNYDGLKEWTYDTDLQSKIGYLNYAPFTDTVKIMASSIEERMMLPQEEPDEYLLSVGVPPKPEEIKEPDKEEVYNRIKSITDSSIDFGEMYQVIIRSIIEEYEYKKEQYNEYLIKIEQWENIKEEKIEENNQSFYDSEMGLERYRTFEEDEIYGIYIDGEVITNQNVIWTFEDGMWTWSIDDNE